MSFSELGLRAELVRAVEAQNYTQPTPVQRKAIPGILSGRDLLAGAQTGTGKTAAFTLPLLHRLAEAPPLHSKGKAQVPSVRALVLTPTRELAAQVGESVTTYGQFLPLTAATVFGGVGIGPQIKALRRGVDILIATPGRLLDLVEQRALDLGQLEVLVLDEADRMLDMGFIRDIKRILKLLPRNRQNLLFSATYSAEIRALAGDLLNDPLEVEVARRNTAAESVAQSVFEVEKSAKRDLLIHLIKQGNWFQVLVFTRTKHGADRLARQLDKAGIEAMAIHGNKSQGARTRALGAFKSGSLRVLVATDIAARGIDIDRLPHVVNYELPNVAEDYVHRIGRTGRAGESGEAISLVDAEERKLLKGIERLIKRPLDVRPLPTFERTPAPAHSEAPTQSRPQGRSQGRSEGRSQGQSQSGARKEANKKPAQGRSNRAPSGPGMGAGAGTSAGAGAQPARSEKGRHGSKAASDVRRPHGNQRPKQKTAKTSQSRRRPARAEA